MKTPYPFELTVYIYRRPHMRDEGLEYEMYVGRGHLDNIFDKEKVDYHTTELLFSFPERWMNIVEERSLYERIKRLYPSLKKLTIKTQSVYIIQCTPAECCRIVSSEEELAYEALSGQLPQENDRGRLWFKTPMNIVKDPSKLTVLS